MERAAMHRVSASLAVREGGLTQQRRNKTTWHRRSVTNGHRMGAIHPRWMFDIRMKVRSDEWKRRALRDHFPEVWLRNTKWTEELETYVVDPEYHWEYYQQAHRQRLYNHPEDYTNFIDDVIDHIELRPKVWVPRALRVFADLEERYGLSQRQYTTLIQVFARARLVKKAEEAFAKIGERKLPYGREAYIALARAYILSRHTLGEDVAVQKCKHLYDEALAKGVFQPEYITLLSFERFYDSLKRLGSELDRKERAAEFKENHPLSEKNFDVKTLWHNIKPRPREPREWSVLGHPLNREMWKHVEWKGVKKGQAYFFQDWSKYGYPKHMRWIEKWKKYREDGQWKEWNPNDFARRNRYLYCPLHEKEEGVAQL
eukprot:TRINITY_DN59431_c0_g1_i1.p1 TRINITY_DN59431_c0_g1~~TRINITY_DN59431_c0_g1_i1.p1  ORF type:complete len:372 (+),score=138.12 TRINITY_DN59431_c0_g1_i1:60-1175(+)